MAITPRDIDFTKETPSPNVIDRWALSNGENIWIAERAADTPDSIRDAVTEFRNAESRKLDGRNDWDHTREDGRILIFGPNQGGYASFIDAASF